MWLLRGCWHSVAGAVVELGGSVAVAACGSEEADLDVEASGVAGVKGEVSAVGGGDGLDDGQAEPEPVVVAGPVGADALEGLEHAVELLWGDGGSGVGHF